MNARLQRDFDLEIQIQPQLQRVALAAITPSLLLLLHLLLLLELLLRHHLLLRHRRHLLLLRLLLLLLLTSRRHLLVVFRLLVGLEVVLLSTVAAALARGPRDGRLGGRCGLFARLVALRLLVLRLLRHGLRR